MIFDKIFKEMLKDKVILIKKLEKTYQSVGKIYFNPIATEVRFKKHTYKVPNQASLINHWGKKTYFLEIDSGKQIAFKDSKIGTAFTSTEMDLILRQGIIRRFVSALKGNDVNNWVMLILALTAGIGLGIVIGLVIGGVI